ncbi:YitT family protein [Bacillus spongiae]|uniref:YitT family protein n=1 Tax=Bacillus spongiae TaxID=2683610 RepID=A0ABU8HDH5_9BACI
MRVQIVKIVCGSLFIGLGINGFFVPHQLLDGGMIGIGLLFHYWLGYQPGFVMIVLSFPLYFFAFIKDKHLFYNSIHGLWLSSLFIDMFTPIQRMVSFPSHASVLLGGVLVGLGIGLLLQANSASGGIDLVAQLISKATGINAGIIIFIIDFMILSLGTVILELHSFILSIMAIMIVAIVTSLLTYEAKKQIPPQNIKKI